jgi:hypothetical protein
MITEIYMFRLVSILMFAAACTSPNHSDGSYLRDYSDGSPESTHNIAAYEKSALKQEKAPTNQGHHEDELVATCVARNKVTRRVFKPVVNVAAIAKIDALMNCVETTVKAGNNPCDCEIAACSPIEPPESATEIIVRLLEDHFPGQTCN